MGALFGKSKKTVSRVTEQDKAVLQLKLQRDKLKQHQKRVEGDLERDRLLARRLLSEGRKERAKLLLRKKRYQEGLLSKADDQLSNLERLTQDIEFAQIQTQVVDGLRAGNEALKKANAALDIGEIELILEETKEGADKQSEIDALLSGALTEEDEEAVEAELESILDRDENVADRLPDVPEEPPPTRAREKTEKRIAVEA